MKKGIPESVRLAVALLLLTSAFVAWADCGRTAGAAERDSPLLPRMEGWKQSGDIQSFKPANLYDYINGAADLFLKYDFQELTVGDYANDNKASVTVEVYRHPTPADAFGIYSQERLAGAKFLPIGAQAYADEGFLCFVAGRYYVKINGSKIGTKEAEVLAAFARKTAANLGEAGVLPAALSLFPEEGKKKNAEKYVAQNFLGYPFFHSGFLAEYERGGKKFYLFIIEGRDAADCRDMLQSYLQKMKLDKAAREGDYSFADPYHGVLDLGWKGKYIWGVLNLDDPALRAACLQDLAKRLNQP